MGHLQLFQNKIKMPNMLGGGGGGGQCLHLELTEP